MGVLVRRRETCGADGLFPQGVGDFFDHATRICEHLRIPEADYAKTMFGDDGGALRVSRRGIRMLATIDLDDEPALEAGEIGDVGTDLDLTPKLQPLDLTVAQLRPENSLRLGRVAAKRIGAGVGHQIDDTIEIAARAPPPMFA